ncbi:hypothetical protein HK405_013050 [Cladochytrium tenue]|nr:hypothetical protein HK405_013050 [Cladochytrium tenue]
MRLTATTVAAVAAAAALACAGTAMPAAAATTVTDSYCDDSSVYCVSAQHDTSSGTVTIAMQTTVSGWLAVGLGGSSMVGPTLYVGWVNNGSVLISERSATAHVDPTVVSTSSSVFTSTSTSLPSWATSLSGAVQTVVFELSSSTDVSTSGSTSCVWAVNTQSPSDPTVASSSLTEHSSKGSFSLNLASTPSSTTSGASSGTTTSAGASASSTVSSNVAISYYCSTVFCVYARRDVANSVVTFNVQSTRSGWVGIGVGSSTMSGATMYVGYTNSSGGITLSERTASEHTQPTITSQQSFTLLGDLTVPSWATSLSGASLIFNFNRSVSVSGSNTISTTGAMDYIWATSGSAPSSPNSYTSSFDQHSEYGSYSLDLSSAGTSTTGTTVSTGKLDISLARLLHGICMFLAWGVCPPAAVFVARYMKESLGHNWYRIHVGLLAGGTLVLTAAGLVFIELGINGSAPALIGNDGAVHRPIGIVLALALLPLQVALGYLINYLYNAERVSIPWWDQVHWWIGRATVLLAVAELYLGLDLIGASLVVRVVYWVWIAACIGLLVYGQFGFGGQKQRFRRRGAELQHPPSSTPENSYGAYGYQHHDIQSNIQLNPVYKPYGSA